MLALIYLSLLGLLGLITFMALPDVTPGRTNSSASQGCRCGSRWLGSPPQPSFGTPPGAQRGRPPPSTARSAVARSAGKSTQRISQNVEMILVENHGFTIETTSEI